MDLDFDAMRKEILNRFNENIKAHIDGNAEFIIDDLGEGFFSMSNAEIAYPSKKEQREEYTRYLNSTTFSEYASVMEPEIGFSDDGSVAWGTFKVKVKGETLSGNGSKSSLDFVCAWLWLFRRVDDRWVRIGEVSSWK
jgi:hypothetical protein